MRFELGYLPMPEGYGEAILSIEACKAHLRVLHDDEDPLIEALRDAAIEYVESYCGIRLGPVTGQTWRGESLPGQAGEAINLAVRPVTAITGIAWADGGGTEVAGLPGDFRFGEDGRLLPAIGKAWPSGIGGQVVVTFDAGFALGKCPPQLLAAVRLMLGHLYLNREAVIIGTISSEAPFGVGALCARYRPVVL